MEADKFSQYVIEITKIFILMNGGAIIAVATLIGNMYDTTNPQYIELLRTMLAKAEYILWFYGGGLLLAPLLLGCAILADFFFVKDNRTETRRFQVARALAVGVGMLSALAFLAGTYNIIEAVKASLPAEIPASATEPTPVPGAEAPQSPPEDESTEP